MSATQIMPLTLTLMCAVTAATGAQTVERPESTLIGDLKSSSETRRHAAVVYIRDNVQPAMRGNELNRALVDELVRLNKVAADRVEEDRAGKLQENFPADYHADLIQLVSQWSNHVVIPALAGALGTGRMVEEAIARFGDQAVPSLLSVASRRVGLVTTGLPGDTPPHVVAGALDTLSRVLASKASLSAASRQSIAAMAGQRLSGKQEPSVIRAASNWQWLQRTLHCGVGLSALPTTRERSRRWALQMTRSQTQSKPTRRKPCNSAERRIGSLKQWNCPRRRASAGLRRTSSTASVKS